MYFPCQLKQRFLSSAIIGGAVSGYVVIYFTSRFISDGWMLGNGVEAQTHVTVLQNLRDGQIEKATESLEAALDIKIISLRNSEENTETTNQAVSQAILKAKEYRAKYPRQSKSPDIDEAVSEVLRQGTK